MNDSITSAAQQRGAEQPDDERLQQRYCELRYDGERTISGVALRYGDIAEIFGEREQFRAGAFGDISRADIILNLQHSRDRIIARTGGAGLSLEDSAAELRVSAELLTTSDGNDALELVRKRALRGFSIEFLPISIERDGGTVIITKADLRGLALVDRPAYKESKVLPRSEDDMKDTEIQDLVTRSVTEALAKRSEGDPPDAAAIATAVSGAIGASLADMPTADSVRAEVDAALAKRDEAEAARAKAEDEKMAMKKKAKDDEEMMKKKADDRAELLLTVHPLLPADTEIRGKSSHELLVLAVGDEVTGAQERSEDYLLAKVEAIAERRAAAAGGTTIVPAKGAPSAASATPVNINRMIIERNMQRERVSA